MTLTDLIKSAEEELANPDLTLGTRRREEAILHHLTNLERTVTELESQNTELYVDLCEMGEMARERSRMRDAVIGIDLAGGVDYTVDPIIRHHLQEDEPKTERVHLYTDDTETQQFFLRGHKFYELTIDKMIRHKWPEEKPEKNRTEYLVATETHGHISCCVAEWNESLTIDQCMGPYGCMHDVGSNGFYEYDNNGYMMLVDDVKYWWNLPEVRE